MVVIDVGTAHLRAMLVRGCCGADEITESIKDNSSTNPNTDFALYYASASKSKEGEYLLPYSVGS